MERGTEQSTRGEEKIREDMAEREKALVEKLRRRTTVEKAEALAARLRTAVEGIEEIADELADDADRADDLARSMGSDTLALWASTIATSRIDLRGRSAALAGAAAALLIATRKLS